ncbi:MAG: hypothetical protein WCI36_00395 [bacterium]
MVPKWFIYFCIFIFSLIGAYVPMIWGDGVFSFSSIMFSGVGGILGIFVAIKIGNSM